MSQSDTANVIAEPTSGQDSVKREASDALRDRDRSSEPADQFCDRTMSRHRELMRDLKEHTSRDYLGAGYNMKLSKPHCALKNYSQGNDRDTHTKIENSGKQRPEPP